MLVISWIRDDSSVVVWWKVTVWRWPRWSTTVKQERVDDEEEEAGAGAEEEGGAAGCAVLCRDGVVGLMVAGPLRPLRLHPPSPAPRYQPLVPLLVPQGSTLLPPTNSLHVLALSESPTNPFPPYNEDAMPALEPPPAAFWARHERANGRTNERTNERTGCRVVTAENRQPGCTYRVGPFPPLPRGFSATRQARADARDRTDGGVLAVSLCRGCSTYSLACRCPEPPVEVVGLMLVVVRRWRASAL